MPNIVDSDGGFRKSMTPEQILEYDRTMEIDYQDQAEKIEADRLVSGGKKIEWVKKEPKR